MRRWMMAFAVLLVAGLVLYFIAGRNSAESPSSNRRDDLFAPSVAADRWPAFQGGGSLRGVAAGAPVPPLKLRWQYRPLKQNAAESGASPVIVGGKVIVSNSRGLLLAINLADGREAWTSSVEDGFEAGPLIVGEQLFIGDLGGVFHALSTADGTKRWTVTTEHPIRGSANVAGEADAARILFANDGGQVTCVDPQGRIIWQRAAADRINGALAISDDRIYFAACDSRLRCWRLDDGSEIFSADMGALSGASPVIAGGCIIVGTDQGKVRCFDSTGRPRWTYDQIEDGSMVYATAAIDAGLVVVGARDRAIHAIRLDTGRRAWALTMRGDVDGAAILSDGRVHVGSRDRTFYILDLKQGNELFTFTADRAIASSAAVAAGVIVFTDSGGNVYCLEGKELPPRTTAPAATGPTPPPAG